MVSKLLPLKRRVKMVIAEVDAVAEVAVPKLPKDQTVEEAEVAEAAETVKKAVNVPLVLNGPKKREKHSVLREEKKELPKAVLLDLTQEAEEPEVAEAVVAVEIAMVKDVPVEKAKPIVESGLKKREPNSVLRELPRSTKAKTDRMVLAVEDVETVKVEKAKATGEANPELAKEKKPNNLKEKPPLPKEKRPRLRKPLKKLLRNRKIPKPFPASLTMNT